MHKHLSLPRCRATLVALVCGCICWATAAQAQTSTVYFGASLGNADMDGLGDDTSYQFITGYNFGSMASMPFPLALEGYYVKLGHPTPTMKVRAFGLDLVAPIELAPRIALLGRLGGTQGKLTVNQTLGDTSTTESALKLGFGLQYQLNKQLGIRGTLDFYKLDPQVDVMSVGLILSL